MEYPKHPIEKDISVRFVSDVTVNHAKSGRDQAVENSPEKIGITVSYNQGTFDEAGDGGYEMQLVWSFLLNCRGQFNTFDFLIEQIFPGTGEDEATGLVETDANNGFEVKLHSLPAAKTILKSGDLIQFGNSQRAYPLAQDLNTSASGKATARLSTPLILPVPAGTAVNIKNIKLRMRLDSNTAELVRNPGRIHTIKSVGLIEAIE